MSDLYQAIANSAVGKKVFSSLNLPIPVMLERHRPDQASFINGAVLVGAALGSKAVPVVLSTLKGASGHRPT